MIITAKFPSYCPVCREKIDVGEKIEWRKGSRTMHHFCSIVVEYNGGVIPRTPREKADAAMLAYAEFESGVSANKW